VQAANNPSNITNKESLAKILKYLKMNEQSAPSVVNQPIEELLSLS
jgi:hypothetical protein